MPPSKKATPPVKGPSLFALFAKVASQNNSAGGQGGVVDLCGEDDAPRDPSSGAAAEGEH
jgi:hypothetical protein